MRKLPVLFGIVFVALCTLVSVRHADAGWSNPAPGTPWYVPPAEGHGIAPTLTDVMEGWANFYGSPPGIPHAVRSVQFLPNLDVYFKVNGICCGDLIGVITHPVCAPGEGEPDMHSRTGCAAPSDPDCPESVNPGTGDESEEAVDFSTGGPNALTLVRYYNGLSRFAPSSLGRIWRTGFDRSIRSESATATWAERPSGHEIEFIKSGSVWVGENDEPETLAQTAGGWQLRGRDDAVEVYDTAGKLLSITTREGYQHTLTYDGAGKLTAVTDSYGRQLQFSYTGNLLTTMIDTAGQVYRYSYQQSLALSVLSTAEADRLTTVTKPDGTVTTYLYEDANFPLALTGILDEKGTRFATSAFDSLGRGVSSERAGGFAHIALAYNADGSTTVTSPLGKQTIYHFTNLFNSQKVTSVEGQASTNCPAASGSITYDSNGYPASLTDFNGNVTNRVFNARGLQTSRTDAYGTPQARTVTTSWHGTFRVPTQVVAPGRTTDFTYDSSGRVLTMTETDTGTQSVPYGTNGQTRTWTYSWDSTGLLQTVNSPRTDVTDTTTYSWTNGVLSSVTNALGQATQVNATDERGLPTEVTDPNGVVTDLAYDRLGRLTSVTKHGAGVDATTAVEYDAIGQITAIVQPDGVRLQYQYDDARRLTAVQNSLGERIEYTLDAAGDRTAEKIKASGGAITQSMTRTYDELGRLLQSIGASSQTTAYAYDNNSNITSITDPLSGVTSGAYDALDRLISSTDPASKTTGYAYDDQDHLTSVTDARSVQTSYVYDGFGRVIQSASPDGGTTVYHYDPAGNVTEKTDGRSVVTDYSYDALNRITTKTFPAATAENVSLSYDDSTPGHYGIGRLASITDQSGSTVFVYDPHGNVAQETRTIAGTAYVTSYVYDVADRLTRMTYPSGRIVAYARDTLGRVIAVTTQASAADAPAAIASNITYKPFGPIASMNYGNGLARTYAYDSDYRLTGLATGDADTSVQDLAYGYDGADNITSIADAIASSRSQTFTYDSLFRLKTAAATGTYGSITYTYDDVGNRTSVVGGAGTETYSTDASSNRLLSVMSSSGTRSFTYDGVGNITADATGSVTYGLAYNKANRLAEVSLNGTPDTDYVYNALGERVKKAPAATPTAGTHFHYDRAGRLIAESDATGAVIREYAWLGSLPIGEFTSASSGTPPGQTQVDNGDAGASFTGNWITASGGAGYAGGDYRKFEPFASGAPLGGTVIDNSSPQFKTLGPWTTETSPSGFEGSDYRRRTAGTGLSPIIVDNADASGFAATGVWTLQTSTGNPWANTQLQHAPNQLPPEAVVVDNVDAGFALTGTWSTATSSGKYGADFRYAPPNQATVDSAITDNDATSTSLTGTWSTSTAAGRYGANFRYSSAGTGSNTFTWTPTIPSSQQYVVYAWWKASSTYATNAPFTIYHDAGSTTVTVNQRINGSRWYPLGTFAMTPGQNHRVVLTNDADGLAIADGVMITPVDSVFRAVWTPTIPQSDQYNVYGWWKANSTYVAGAPFTIIHGGGTTTVTVNQQTNGGQWNLLGTFAMAPGQNHRVFMTDQGTGGDNVIADAVQVTRVGAPPPMAIFTPTLPARDRYLAYARWYYWPSYATNAPFVVQHEGGSTTVRMSQADSGLSKKWNLLGTFIMAPGQNHGIELHDDASATVIADAVEFVPEAAAKTATWEIPGSVITQTGSYKVYAKWPAAGSNATDAVYTVSYEGGSKPVPANQRKNGGQWNLLGEFAFNAGGSGYKVELSDAAVSGAVAADAIYIVRAGAPTGASFTWTPTFPSAGAYQVYARWPASSANTGAAQYTVTRDGGTSTVTLSQKQNGGSWVPLGSYAFTPGAGQKVTLAASTDGTTIADALLFVGAGAQPANLLYVHADHLGAPQKMTDASQAIVWDGVVDPYGRESGTTGLAAMPLRFPGQYADDETGYNYNYFRFYDPSIGRYLQSDPLGIAVGLNTYTYVDDNPVNWVDPRGTCAQSAAIGAAIGAMMELMRQALVPLKCFHGVDWGKVGEAMAWGAAFGCGGELLLEPALAGAAKWGQRFIDGEIGGAEGGIGGGGGDIGGETGASEGGVAETAESEVSSGPAYKNWNEFQEGTAGQFSSRAEAGEAWKSYKSANGIETGSVRSQAARSAFLRSLADDPNTPSWMRQFLSEGRTPPGYEVDHIEPLSVGGSDTSENMRLQGADLHDIHHKFYRPWDW